MNVSGWEDPNLKPTHEKILRYIRNNYIRDPYLQRMFDFRAKGMIQHVPMAAYLHAKDEAKTHLRKYHGEFHFADFFAANKARLLFLNFGELFGLKNNLLSQELRSFSRNLFRGPMQGYLANTAAYFGIYGHASYRAGKSQEKFATFMITTFLSAVALAPLQYIASQAWNNYNQRIVPTRDIKMTGNLPGFSGPLLADASVLRYQRFFSFAPLSVAFSTIYGFAVYCNNVNNVLLNLAYYPLLVSSYVSLSYAGAANKVFQNEFNFESIRNLRLPRSSNLNLTGLGLFLALNTVMPLRIEQLHDKDEFKHSYLEFVNDSEEFKIAEGMYA